MTSPNEPAALRPRFPRGYGIPESADGILSWGWAEARLQASRNYWVSSTKPDGAPHAMPVSLDRRRRRVQHVADSRKGRNLARDPRAVLHAESGDEVVILEVEVEEIRLDRRIADLYAAKYDYRPEPGSPDEAWYRLRPRTAYAWADDFPRSVTRFVFD